MNLHEQVSTLVRATSEKYTPEPGKNDILSDAIIGLWRFSNSCRWKEFWRIKKLEKARESDLSPTAADCDGFFESEVIEEPKKRGGPKLKSEGQRQDQTSAVRLR
jgi:hypothetical protein